jgi:hypothetical protein
MWVCWPALVVFRNISRSCATFARGTCRHAQLLATFVTLFRPRPGTVGDPVPFSTVQFRDLAAQGLSHGLGRFSFSPKSHFEPSVDAVANAGQLMRTGFAVS